MLGSCLDWFLRIFMKKFILVWLIFSFSPIAIAADSSISKIGQSSDWAVYKYFEQNGKGERFPICSLSSNAIISLPKSLSTRKAVAYITKRQNQNSKKWFYEIAFKTDIALLANEKPKLKIGKVEFKLFAGATRSGREAFWAWAANKRTLRVLLAAMRAGDNMELIGLIENQQEVRDRFSLFGVSAGLIIIEENCK